MTTTTDAAEQYVTDLYVTLCLGRGTCPAPRTVADVAMGNGAVMFGDARTARLVDAKDGARIVVGRAVPRGLAHWYVAHRLAHWLLREDGADDETMRLMRSPIAAALLMPRDLVRSAPASVVVERVVTPLPAATLRVAELGAPAAAFVVAGRYARVRGAGGAIPMSVRALEALASDGVTPLRVRRTRVDNGVLLVAA